MLAHSFVTQAARHFPNCEVRALGRDELDVLDLQQLLSWTDWIRGGHVVHCAAVVNVEGCARDPLKARAVIVEGARNVVALARAAKARLFYPQSFLVYDGRHNPIPEDETPRPLSLYGELKYEAERTIEEALPEALIVRMAGFFGGGARDKNFVGRILPRLVELLRAGTSVFPVGDRVWQPTHTDDLALNSLILMLANKTGSYQMASEGEASFAALTEAIVEEVGFQELIKIEHVSAQKISQEELGRRPDRAVLSCQRLRDEGLYFQNPWRASLAEYLSRGFFDQYRDEVARRT